MLNKWANVGEKAEIIKGKNEKDIVVTTGKRWKSLNGINVAKCNRKEWKITH